MCSSTFRHRCNAARVASAGQRLVTAKLEEMLWKIDLKILCMTFIADYSVSLPEQSRMFDGNEQLTHDNKDLPCILFPDFSHCGGALRPEKPNVFHDMSFSSAPSQALNHQMNDSNPSHAKAPDAAQNIFLS